MKPLLATIQMVHSRVIVCPAGMVMDFFAMTMMSVLKDLTTAT